jgi:dTDP-4-dehydrorhamnose reductase
MKIGVLGPKGRLGRALVSMGCSPIDCDITKKDQLLTAKLDQFDIVINCAAITQVDKCQIPPKAEKATEFYKKAVKVNSMALELVRSSFSGRLIHISTDYIFKGDNGPYKEADVKNPVDDYGFTKWGGELVLDSYPFDNESVIVRTTGLYGSGEDFASYVINSLKNGEKILASSELYGNQTYIPHLCQALLYISEAKFHKINVVTYLHVGSKEVISRYTFAKLLADAFDLPSDLIVPCKNSDITNWVAPRPTKGGMFVDKAIKFGVPIFTIDEGLQAYKESVA